MLLLVLSILGKALLYALTFTHSFLLGSDLVANMDSNMRSEQYPRLVTSCTKVGAD